MNLVPHPAFPPRAVRSVSFAGDFGARRAVLDYVVDGGSVRMADPAEPRRVNELWRTTCFELFVRTAREPGYCEFNFAPSGEWAAYRFDAYRAGMADLAVEPPSVERAANGVRVTFSPPHLRLPWLVAPTAVIEEEDGTRSFWALAHPPDRPDFHHEACFALRVPPAS